MEFIIYFLRCSDSSLYCGYTNSLKKRLLAHNKGTASKYTRSRRPVKIVYFEEAKTKSSALKREYALKQLSKNEKEILVQKAKQLKVILPNK
ncbi:MAG: GIY-YIG nuclease family protein [archaeon]